MARQYIYLYFHTYMHQVLENEGYNPEFPVLEGLDPDVFSKSFPHVIKALTGDGDASGRELLLTHTAMQIIYCEKNGRGQYEYVFQIHAKTHLFTLTNIIYK